MTSWLFGGKDLLGYSFAWEWHNKPQDRSYLWHQKNTFLRYVNSAISWQRFAWHESLAFVLLPVINLAHVKNPLPNAYLLFTCTCMFYLYVINNSVMISWNWDPSIQTIFILVLGAKSSIQDGSKCCMKSTRAERMSWAMRSSSLAFRRHGEMPQDAQQGFSGRIWLVTSFQRHRWPKTKMYKICDTVFWHFVSCPFHWWVLCFVPNNCPRNHIWVGENSLSAIRSFYWSVFNANTPSKMNHTMLKGMQKHDEK